MERLWSPWRHAYITAADPRPAGCVFCLAADPHQPDRSLVVADGTHAFVILNLYPYNSGHLMVVPRRHLDALGLATADELQEIITLVRDAELVLAEVYRPAGINVGMNLGRAAGAGIADHLHVHLVPRWEGDTNFVTVVGETRVLPEALATTADRLRPAFARLRDTRR
jgi:ATP adenylyltransferase